MNGTEAFVCVVDDDASVREGVAHLARSAGLTATTFASREEFLAAPRPKPPGCLVLDLNLPGVSGLDVQRELTKIWSSGAYHIPLTPRRPPNGRARGQSRCSERDPKTFRRG
jgi:FixJ family two-component response regulator